MLSSKFSLSRLVSLRLFFSELVLDVHLNAVSIHTYIHTYIYIYVYMYICEKFTHADSCRHIFKAA